MTNPVLKWALQTLQNPKETSANESVAQALKLVGVNPDQIQVNQQPLESIFSVIDEQTSIIEKNISWQPLDVQQIVYPRERADAAQLNVPEPTGGWDRFHADENLALTLIENTAHSFPFPRKSHTSPSMTWLNPLRQFMIALKTDRLMHRFCWFRATSLAYKT